MLLFLSYKGINVVDLKCCRSGFFFATAIREFNHWHPSLCNVAKVNSSKTRQPRGTSNLQTLGSLKVKVPTV